MTTIAIPEKFKEELRIHKPHDLTWGQYLMREFSKISNIREVKADRDFYQKQYEELTKANDKYANLIKRANLIKNEELQSLLKPIIATNGNVSIALYNNTTIQQI